MNFIQKLYYRLRYGRAVAANIDIIQQINRDLAARQRGKAKKVGKPTLIKDDRDDHGF